MINNLFENNVIDNFLDNIFLNLEQANIDVSNYELDHVCYRVSTEQNYEKLKNQLVARAELLSEVIISGRNIASYKLNKPILYKNREISVLEIPAPKKGSDYEDGYEHVEFVIDISFDEFIKKYPDLDYGMGGINKEINPELKVGFGDISVKFHHHSLEYVIRNFEQ